METSSLTLTLTREQALERYTDIHIRIRELTEQLTPLRAIIFKESLPPQAVKGNRMKPGSVSERIGQILREYNEPMNVSEIVKMGDLREDSVYSALKSMLHMNIIHRDKKKHKYSLAVHRDGDNSASTTGVVA